MHFTRLTIAVAICMLAATAFGQSAASFPDFSPAPAWVSVTPAATPIVQQYLPPSSGVNPAAYQASCTEPAQGMTLGPPNGEAWLRPPTQPPQRMLPPPNSFDPNAVPRSLVPPSSGLPQSVVVPGVEGPQVWYSHPRQFVFDVWQDHRNYYSWHHAALLGIAFGGGAIMANTEMDQNFRDYFQRQVGYNGTLHAFHVFGEGAIVLPFYAAMTGLGWVFDERPVIRTVGNWGEQSLRASLVGFPPMLFMQLATGGSRPTDGTYGSHWHPFQDNNGVSGHSFMGAIPFLTAARMTDRPLLKVVFVTGSFMTGLSRVSDDKHYFSQAILGWAMAGVAVSAVGQTETGQPFRLVPWSTPIGFGLGYEWRR